MIVSGAQMRWALLRPMWGLPAWVWLILSDVLTVIGLTAYLTAKLKGQ